MEKNISAVRVSKRDKKKYLYCPQFTSITFRNQKKTRSTQQSIRDGGDNREEIQFSANCS